MFFGHCWIDAPNTSASAVVSAADKKQAERIAKALANKLWETRKEYRFQIEAEEATECVKRAIEGGEKRIFITDSGDNTTAGAEGDRVDILKLMIEAKPQKRTCVAGITNKGIVNEFWSKGDGDEAFLNIIGGVKAKIKAHGVILGWAKEIIGRSLFRRKRRRNIHRASVSVY